MNNHVKIPDHLISWIQRENRPQYFIAAAYWLYRHANSVTGELDYNRGRKNASIIKGIRQHLAQIKGMTVPGDRQIWRFLAEIEEAGFLLRDAAMNTKAAKFIGQLANTKSPKIKQFTQAAKAASGLFFATCQRLVSEVRKSKATQNQMSEVGVRGSANSNKGNRGLIDGYAVSRPQFQVSDEHIAMSTPMPAHLRRENRLKTA